MNSSDQETRRSREIAQNEAQRQNTGDIRVSVWALVLTTFVAVIVIAIVWFWYYR